MAKPRHVQVYGNDHSPWVQAVLLGLHDGGIDHVLVGAPPLAVFLESGVLMPAARFDGGGWQRDSAHILKGLGYSAVGDGRARSLERLFLRGAMHRVDDPWQFWKRFSFARDDHPSTLRHLWNHVWRAFPVFYFFVIISFARGRRGTRDADALLAAFEPVQAELSEGVAFLGGDAPDTADFQLFGIVQMFASIPGLPLQLLREEARLAPLRAWVSRMQERFADHAHLYSATGFEPILPAPRSATRFERMLFWVGAAACWLALPITLPLVLFYTWWIRNRKLV